MKNDSLGDRMKGYENITRIYLERKKPVIIRIDGKAFHTLTKGCKKPYDGVIIKTMQYVTEFLMKNIQGAKVGYVQSDEISLLITDYDRDETAAWFDYNVQKMVSVAASMAGVTFSQRYMISRAFQKKPELAKPGYFDARAFSLDKDEVVNYFRWRFQDCTRNSMSMLAQSLYSQKELNGKKWAEQGAMCEAKGQSWFDLDEVYRFGTCYYWDDSDGKVLVGRNPDLHISQECNTIFGRYI